MLHEPLVGEGKSLHSAGGLVLCNAACGISSCSCRGVPLAEPTAKLSKSRIVLLKQINGQQDFLGGHVQILPLRRYCWVADTEPVVKALEGNLLLVLGDGSKAVSLLPLSLYQCYGSNCHHHGP